jgi:hypothetical protein
MPAPTAPQLSPVETKLGDILGSLETGTELTHDELVILTQHLREHLTRAERSHRSRARWAGVPLEQRRESMAAVRAALT